MELQELITRLSAAIAELGDIKMKKVRGELDAAEAKKQASEALSKSLEGKLSEAIEEWKNP